MQKLLVVAIAFTSALVVQWFAHNGGKFPTSGEFLGWHYDSTLISSVVFNIKFIWVITIVNIAFVFASKTGTVAFNSFLSFILIWIASAPVAAFVYNAAVGKEHVNVLHVIGVALVFTGAVLISANKEILEKLS